MLDVQLGATCNYSVNVHAPALQAGSPVLQRRRTRALLFHVCHDGGRGKPHSSHHALELGLAK